MIAVKNDKPSMPIQLEKMTRGETKMSKIEIKDKVYTIPRETKWRLKNNNKKSVSVCFYC